MIIRGGRFLRGRNTLWSASRRFLTTEEAPGPVHAAHEGQTTPAKRQSPPRSPGQGPSHRSRAFDLVKNVFANSETGEVPALHPLLQQGYTEGAHLERGKRLDVLDHSGLPRWGEWGVPIAFELDEKAEGSLLFPNFWLRDNCRCSKCVNQDTMQRAFDTFMDITPREVITEKKGLRIIWNHEDHSSFYTWEWLLKHGRRNEGPSSDPLTDNKNYVLWGADISDSPPSVHYDEIMADEKGVGRWTDKIIRYGFSYVDGCPVSPEKTQELLERIAFIRTTHYGGFYDFTSDLTMKDTAYTSLALGAHTDTTYFSDPAGLQMFHLLSHTDGSGGKSLLVDGFRAAKKLKSVSRVAYDLLCRTPILWHASGNEGITITPGKKHPVFTQADHSPSDPFPRMLQVRWNNDDRGVVTMEADDWYSAARLWSGILNRNDMQYWAQLEPGRPLIFDNWRVLHGRSAFTGKRRICGGYVNHDDFVSRWRNTNFTRDEVLRQIL